MKVPPFHRQREIPSHEYFCQEDLGYCVILTLVDVVKINMAL